MIYEFIDAEKLVEDFFAVAKALRYNVLADAVRGCQLAVS